MCKVCSWLQDDAPHSKIYLGNLLFRMASDFNLWPRCKYYILTQYSIEVRVEDVKRIITFQNGLMLGFQCNFGNII